MRPHFADEVAAALAQAQRGLFSRWQLVERGVSASVIANRVRAGRWIVLYPGVYGLGHRELRREAWWLASTLACGRSGASSHITGAAVLGLLFDNGPKPHVTVPHGTHPVEGILVHRSKTLAPQDVTVHDGIPVTSVSRTLLDVAATHRALLPRAIDQSEQLQLFDLRAIQDVIARNTRHRGVRPLLAALDDFLPGAAIADSVLGDMFLQLVLAAGLPRPEREVYVLDRRADFLWREERVVVEADGWGSHGTRRSFQRDRTWDRDLQFASYVPLRVTRRDVLSGARDVLEGLADLLATRSGRIRRL